jgi:integrase
VWARDGKRARVWYAKYRLPDGRQEQRKLGPQWTGSGRPPEGYFTERTAQAALEAILTDARRGTLASLVRTGATVRDACEEWFRHARDERAVKPGTLREYRSVLDKHLIPAFGDEPVEQVTTEQVERWRSELLADGKLSRRTISKLLTNLHGVFERARRAYGLRSNPVTDVERHTIRYDSGRFDFYSPEEVHAIVRAAESEQDGSLILTAAFTGLRRGELVALRWRDVDFPGDAIRVRASFSHGHLVTPKSGKVRSVPMVPAVAQALAKLAASYGDLPGEDALVFPGEAGDYLDASALRRRFVKAVRTAGVRELRFHDLRHTFGSLAISKASVVDLQSWLGHADQRTTARYLHYKPRTGEARLLAGAFAVEEHEAEGVR